MSLLRMLGFKKPGSEITIKSISVDEAHELVLTARLTLIDVRQPEEWNDTGRPQGSHGVTLQDTDFLEKTLHVMDQDKSKPVAFSCKGGGRSSQAAERAKSAGHLMIFNVTGGFTAWSQAKLPTSDAPF